MNYLGLIIVVATMTLVAEQVLARRINEMDSQLEQLETRGATDELRDFLENRLRKKICNGDSSMGIPPMDPFQNESMKLELNEKFVTGAIELLDFNVKGLAGYKVREVEVSLFRRKVTVALRWPKIESVGSYNAKVALQQDKFYGSGNYAATLENVTFAAEASFRLMGGLSIHEIETRFTIGSLAMSASGLQSNDEALELTGSEISEKALQWLRDHHNDITRRINDVAKRMINKHLSGKYFQEMIAMQ